MQQDERWQKIEDLFNQAVQLSARRRIPFVQQSCGGDQELCDEVISLLAADSQSNEILNDSIFPLVAHLLDDDITQLLKNPDFASYRLLEMLERGGMGAVFLAEDKRLERMVALKVLPSTSATNQESVLRFQQEAKAASSITNPHIAHVYEFGTYNGLYFFAMEYVDGKTVRRLLKEKQIDLKQSVETAIQIANALEAAHGVSVTHRDIKPENLMITRDGVCKVLDFGLAKLNLKKWRRGSQDSLETTPGLIIGTSTYMSPEQIRGKDVDERTDLWSLGVVLYEMLAGKRPFDGETRSDVQAAILLKDFEPLPQANELPELEKIVRKALQKNVNERYQTAEEMHEDLKAVQRRIYDYLINETKSLDSLPEQNFRPAVDSKIYFTGFFILVLLGLAVGSFLFDNFTLQSNEPKVAVEQIQRVTNSGKAMYAALSPNGEWAAFVLEEAGRESLYLRRLNDSARNARLVLPPLTEKGGFVGVAFSPDNEFVYYAFKSEGIFASLYRSPVAGGEAQKILDDIDTAPSFSPDGKQIVFLRIAPDGNREDLIVADAEGNREEIFFTRRKPDFIPHKATPAWSPDGQLIVAPIGFEERGERKVRLAGIRLSDRSLVQISGENWAEIAQIAWSPEGKSLTMAARKSELREEKQIWRVRQEGGEAIALTNDPNDYEGISVAHDGQSVLTIAINRKVDAWLLDYSAANGQPVQMTFGNDVANGVAWTFDDRIVYSSTASGNSDIWMMNADGSGARQLTIDSHADIQPIVSPDNQFVVFVSARSGNREIWRMDLDGNNQTQLTNGAAANTPTITADGKNIIYYAQSESGGSLYCVSIEGGKPELISVGVRRYPSVSLDGKWLVTSCRPENAKNNKICIASINDISNFARVFEPAPGANSPSKMRWTGRESDAFTYIVNNRGVENIWKQPIDGSPASSVTNFNENYIYAFDWSPDGKKLVCGRGNTSNSAVLLKLKKLE